MLGGKDNSLENKDEACRKLCKEDIDKLEAIMKNEKNKQLSNEKSPPNSAVNFLAPGRSAAGQKSNNVFSSMEYQKPSETTKPLSQNNSVTPSKRSQNIPSGAIAGEQSTSGRCTELCKKNSPQFNENEKENLKVFLKECRQNRRPCPTIDLIIKENILKKISKQAYTCKTKSEIPTQASSLCGCSQKKQDKIRNKLEIEESNIYNKQLGEIASNCVCQNRLICKDSLEKVRVNTPHLSQNIKEAEVAVTKPGQIINIDLTTENKLPPEETEATQTFATPVNEKLPQRVIGTVKSEGARYNVQPPNEQPPAKIGDVADLEKTASKKTTEDVNLGDDYDSPITPRLHQKPNWNFNDEDAANKNINVDSEQYHCQVNKPCPTVNTILHKIKSQTFTETKDLINEDKSMYCHEKEPCPTVYSLLNENILPCAVMPKSKNKSDIEELLKADIAKIAPLQPKTNQSKTMSQLSGKQLMEDIIRTSKLESQNIAQLSAKRNLENKKWNFEGENRPSTANPVQTKKSKRIEKTSVISENIGNLFKEEEIKSTDLNQHSNDIVMPDNEFARWSRNCKKGTFALTNLLNTCKNDPDSILLVVKNGYSVDRKVPSGSSATPYEPRETYELEKIYGKKFGDPKYHLLMIDVATSIHKIDFVRKEGEVEKEQEKDDEVEKEQEKDDEVEKEQEKDDEEDEKKDEETEESKEDEESEVEVLVTTDELIQIKKSEEEKRSSVRSDEDEESSVLISVQEDTSISDVESENTIQEEKYPQTYAPPPKVTSAEEKSVPPDSTEQDQPPDPEKKTRRVSNVSWRPTTDTRIRSDTSVSNASLDQVVKNATTKAENFRQNLDARRQHSLLGVIKKKSSVDKIVDESKPVNIPPPVKRKKFFNFKCFDRKKPKKEKEESVSESDEDSVESDVKSPTKSSSTFLDTYKRRNTSHIDNPVFEKNKELNQILNNI